MIGRIGTNQGVVKVGEIKQRMCNGDQTDEGRKSEEEASSGHFDGTWHISCHVMVDNWGLIERAGSKHIVHWLERRVVKKSWETKAARQGKGE